MSSGADVTICVGSKRWNIIFVTHKRVREMVRSLNATTCVYVCSPFLNFGEILIFAINLLRVGIAHYRTHLSSLAARNEFQLSSELSKNHLSAQGFFLIII